MIRRKTAKLFEAAARLGAVLAGRPELEEALAAYGRHVGTAFQLIDDVLDYGGDLGKNLGDDLAEGKPTLPLIYTMRCGSPEQAGVVRKAVEDGGRAAVVHLQRVLSRPRKLGYVVHVSRNLHSAGATRLARSGPPTTPPSASSASARPRASRCRGRRS